MDIENKIKKLEAEKDVEELLNIIFESYPYNEEAKKAIINIGDSAVDELNSTVDERIKKRSSYRLKQSKESTISGYSITPTDYSTYNLEIIAEILGEIGNPKAINHLIAIIASSSPIKVRESAGNALIKLNAATYNTRKCALEIMIPSDYNLFTIDLNYEAICPHCNTSNKIDITDDYFDNLLGKESNLTMAEGFSKQCWKCSQNYDWTEGYIVNYIKPKSKKKFWKRKKF